jgi:hypothetical protein
VAINMASDSHRHGKVYEWDNMGRKVVDSGPGYAKGWEKLSADRAAPRHVPGWSPMNKDPMFSRQQTPSWQSLEGPWPDATTDPGK